MTYKNDFVFSANTDELSTPAWSEQPITIPLNEWTELLLDNADLRARLDAMALRWSESNERIRHLENENARLKGDIDAMFKAAGEVE